MTIEELRELHGTDGNEACHAFWDKCGTEILDLWEHLNKLEQLLKIADNPHEAKSYKDGLALLNYRINEARWSTRPLLEALNAKAASIGSRKEWTFEDYLEGKDKSRSYYDVALKNPDFYRLAENLWAALDTIAGGRTFDLQEYAEDVLKDA